jgi:hypothetical protein
MLTYHLGVQTDQIRSNSSQNRIHIHFNFPNTRILKSIKMYNKIILSQFVKSIKMYSKIFFFQYYSFL